jgi:hypothetical protein
MFNDDVPDDYDGLPPDPRLPRQTRTSAAATVILILGRLVLAMVVLCDWAVAQFWFNAHAVPPPVAATAVQQVPPDGTRVYDRADLRGLVLGSDRNGLIRTPERPTRFEMG